MNELTRILYVEDDLDIQTVAKLALEVVGGFNVKVCSSGEEAMAEADHFSPDLILLDVMMPGMDGPNTMASLRQLNTRWMQTLSATLVNEQRVDCLDASLTTHPALQSDI
jgi:CheY-like chemotaxis protein